MIIGLSNHSIPFTATGEVIIFDGFLKVYMESHDEETDDEQAGLLPALAPGDQLQRQLITAIEQYTNEEGERAYAICNSITSLYYHRFHYPIMPGNPKNERWQNTGEVSGPTFLRH